MIDSDFVVSLEVLFSLYSAYALEKSVEKP